MSSKSILIFINIVVYSHLLQLNTADGHIDRVIEQKRCEGRHTWKIPKIVFGQKKNNKFK